jgi:DNA primase
VVLVEGYTDVVAMHQAGIRNAVASMGTALTEGQAGELGKLAGTLLLCLDADTAGQEAMLRAEAAVRAGTRAMEVRVVPLPAGSDPAEIVQREGADAMRDLLACAAPFARWQVDRALGRADVTSAEGRDRVLEEVRAVIRPLPPSVLREELVRLVSGRLALSEGLVAASLGDGGTAAQALSGRPANGNGSGGASREGGSRAGGAARRTLDHREETEHAFLALCLAVPEAGGTARLSDPATLDLFASPLTRRAAEHLRDHPTAPAAALPPEDADLARLVAEIVLRARGLEAAEPSELDRAALLLTLARLDREIHTARLDEVPVSDLAVERQRVLGELRKLSH